MTLETANARARKKPSVVRVHIWLETEQGVSFGMGRLLLLQAIQKHGSIKAAAESLGMSYRAAWGKLKSSEKLLGRPLVEKPRGNRSGCQLTPYGREIMFDFAAWFSRVEGAAVSEASKIFPFPIQSFRAK